MKPKEVKSADGLVKIIFLAGLLVSPFVFYEIPRVWFINRWIEILGLTVLVNLLFRKKPLPINSTIDGKLIGLVIGFFVWAVAASILGADPSKSLWGNYYRSDGLFTLAHLIGLFLFTALFWQSSWQKIAVKVLAVGSLIVSILALVNTARGMIFSPPFGQPNFLAGYLTVTLPFVWVTFKNRWSKIAVVFPIAAIGITKSWGGLIAIIIFFTYLIVKKLSPPIRLAAASVLAAAIILAAFYLWQTQWSQPYWSRPFVPESRERIIRSLFGAARRRPLIGWGWANVDYAFESNPWPMKFEPDIYLDKAHGILLEILTTTGIIGLTIYVLVIGRGVWLARNTAVFLPLVLYLVYSQTNITSVATEVIFWLTLGVAASQRRDPRPPHPISLRHEIRIYTFQILTPLMV